MYDRLGHSGGAARMDDQSLLIPDVLGCKTCELRHRFKIPSQGDRYAGDNRHIKALHREQTLLLYHNAHSLTSLEQVISSCLSILVAKEEHPHTEFEQGNLRDPISESVSTSKQCYCRLRLSREARFNLVQKSLRVLSRSIFRHMVELTPSDGSKIIISWNEICHIFWPYASIVADK